jgi:hypothetical protein
MQECKCSPVVSGGGNLLPTPENQQAVAVDGINRRARWSVVEHWPLVCSLLSTGFRLGLEALKESGDKAAWIEKIRSAPSA